MAEPDYLKDLEDSLLTTLQVYRRTADMVQFMADKQGRKTRYVAHEAVTELFDQLPPRHQQEFYKKFGKPSIGAEND